MTAQPSSEVLRLLMGVRSACASRMRTAVLPEVSRGINGCRLSFEQTVEGGGGVLSRGGGGGSAEVSAPSIVSLYKVICLNKQESIKLILL